MCDQSHVVRCKLCIQSITTICVISGVQLGWHRSVQCTIVRDTNDPVARARIVRSDEQRPLLHQLPAGYLPQIVYVALPWYHH